jgi:hypothetical protein
MDEFSGACLLLRRKSIQIAEEICSLIVGLTIGTSSASLDSSSTGSLQCDRCGTPDLVLIAHQTQPGQRTTASIAAALLPAERKAAGQVEGALEGVHGNPDRQL